MLDREKYAAVGITILEESKTMVHFSVETEKGPVEIMAEFLREDKRLIIDKADVDGEGLNVGMIRKLARLCGQVEDVGEVVLVGGKRSSGRSRGRFPTPIRVRVQR